MKMETNMNEYDQESYGDKTHSERDVERNFFKTSNGCYLQKMKLKQIMNDVHSNFGAH